MKHLLLFSWLLCFLYPATAQQVTHGPIVGAVTSTGCKIYVRTQSAAEVTLKVWQHDDARAVMAFKASTGNNDFDNSVIIPVTGLQSNTVYQLQILVDGKADSIQSSFRTFPREGEAGDYTFVTGSCQETKNMKVFNAMPKWNPYLIMHTGDYTYPSYMLAPDYSATRAGIEKSYRRRYDEKEMKQMLYNVPIDYLYDDDDYVGADDGVLHGASGGRYCVNDWSAKIEHGKIVHTFYSDTFPAAWRRNVIKGYNDFFPHYDLPDTSEGIYHSFTLGNAEFFVIDRNSDRDWPSKDAFKYDSAKHKLVFAPPPGWAMFGKKQIDWLKGAIKKSKADWKFIVSGVPLNGACMKLVKAGLALQKMHYKSWFGFHMAWGFGGYWCAFPEERNDFMNFLKDNNIKNVLVVSGDTHHCVMDDGKNAGLPELNASGLSVATTELAKYLKLIGNATGLYHMNKIWNKGGIGLSNHKKCLNGFGKVRIVGRDYVEMSIVDENNIVVSSFKVPFQKP